mmetsp:Transcript_5514/g.15369  ORF Transcript_5514/g.15369 Transcript_5514/m.15369 type:complete len:206 (+) Transcript_5514:1570-2187(+)
MRATPARLGPPTTLYAISSRWAHCAHASPSSPRHSLRWYASKCLAMPTFFCLTRALTIFRSFPGSERSAALLLLLLLPLLLSSAEAAVMSWTPSLPEAPVLRDLSDLSDSPREVGLEVVRRDCSAAITSSPHLRASSTAEAGIIGVAVPVSEEGEASLGGAGRPSTTKSMPAKEMTSPSSALVGRSGRSLVPLIVVPLVEPRSVR